MCRRVGRAGARLLALGGAAAAERLGGLLEARPEVLMPLTHFPAGDMR